jgi:hypothetical protein
MAGLGALVLPAVAGLSLTSMSGRWMAALFGPAFRDGGMWLVLVAARLPWLLAGSVSQAALIACRREDEALSLVAGMATLAALTIPLAAWCHGPWGVGIASLCVEGAGAVAGWLLLRRIGVAPPWHHHAGPTILGCLAMVAVCHAAAAWPLWGVALAGAVAYSTILAGSELSRRAGGAGEWRGRECA